MGNRLPADETAARELAASMVEKHEWAEYECNGWE